MKDIKDAEITFAPVRIRLLQFDEFFRGWVSVAGTVITQFAAVVLVRRRRAAVLSSTLPRLF